MTKVCVLMESLHPMISFGQSADESGGHPILHRTQASLPLASTDISHQPHPCRIMSASNEVICVSPLTSAFTSHPPMAASCNAIAESVTVILPSPLRSPFYESNTSILVVTGSNMSFCAVICSVPIASVDVSTQTVVTNLRA